MYKKKVSLRIKEKTALGVLVQHRTTFWASEGNTLRFTRQSPLGQTLRVKLVSTTISFVITCLVTSVSEDKLVLPELLIEAYRALNACPPLHKIPRRQVEICTFPRRAVCFRPGRRTHAFGSVLFLLLHSCPDLCQHGLWCQ